MKDLELQLFEDLKHINATCVGANSTLGQLAIMKIDKSRRFLTTEPETRQGLENFLEGIVECAEAAIRRLKEHAADLASIDPDQAHRWEAVSTTGDAVLCRCGQWFGRDNHKYHADFERAAAEEAANNGQVTTS